jgi:nucleoside-diphosphate-sugar epimerase
MSQKKILLAGGAGLVGQNLIVRLKAKGYTHIVVLDRHPTNLELLKKLQPDITTELCDLSEPGSWQQHFIGVDVVVMLQARIGGNDYREFVRDNVESTRRVLDAIKAHGAKHMVHVSSSVVASVADDFYTVTKRDQEMLVLESGLACTVLRPTLMFGWFDRKHLGWLSRFMKKVPVFPVPGHGRYMRQPLYVGDFCNIIIKCMESHAHEGIYNISGYEKINYIDIIRAVKRSTGSGTVIAHIPYALFYTLLWIWGLFDKNPPFTTQQLAALCAKDEFEVIDWAAIFGVRHTPFQEAIEQTFNDPQYSNVVLDF